MFHPDPASLFFGSQWMWFLIPKEAGNSQPREKVNIIHAYLSSMHHTNPKMQTPQFLNHILSPNPWTVVKEKIQMKE